MENINLKIRKANNSDATAISDVLRMAFSDYYNVLGVKIPTVSESMEDIIGDIEQNDVYVAVANNMLIIGTIRYRMISDICYIYRFGILPKWQSSGCGKLLLEQVETCARQSATCAMALHTATRLQKQIMYYYSQGFYIHSTTDTKGYIRALLIRELACAPSADAICLLV